MVPDKQFAKEVGATNSKCIEHLTNTCGSCALIWWKPSWMISWLKFSFKTCDWSLFIDCAIF